MGNEIIGILVIIIIIIFRAFGRVSFKRGFFYILFFAFILILDGLDRKHIFVMDLLYFKILIGAWVAVAITLETLFTLRKKKKEDR